jgi:hypothetical protein
MKTLEADKKFSWQRMGDETTICVVGHWVDPEVDRVPGRGARELGDWGTGGER